MCVFQIKFFIFLFLFSCEIGISRNIHQWQKFRNKKSFPNAHLQIAYKVQHIKNMPYAVIIDVFQAINGTPKSSLCSGVIVSKQVILSAAHCFSECRKKTIEPEDVRIRIGCTRLSQPTYVNICEDYKPKKMEIPKQWEGVNGVGGRKCNSLLSDYEYDIAVLILAKPINNIMFNSNNVRAAIAKLPEDTTFINNPVAIAGYGDNEKLTDGVLYATWVNTYTQIDCFRLWKEYYNFTIVQKDGQRLNERNKPFPFDYICINYTTKICRGDSGGPMLECGAQNCFPNCLLPECPNAIVVGITNCNWYECTANQNPIYPRVLNPNDPNDREIKVGAFYTDVRVHLAWIKQMITKNGVRATAKLIKPPKKNRGKEQKQHNVFPIKLKLRKG